MNQRDTGKSRKGGFLDPFEWQRKATLSGRGKASTESAKDDPMSAVKWELWQKSSAPNAGKIFVSITPLGKGRISKAAVKTLVPWAERENRLQSLVDRERGAFALQSTSPDNLDSFESHLAGDTYLDLKDLFNSLGFALSSKTKRIYGKVGTDPATGNKIVEFLLTDSFSRMIP